MSLLLSNIGVCRVDLKYSYRIVSYSASVVGMLMLVVQSCRYNNSSRQRKLFLDFS